MDLNFKNNFFFVQKWLAKWQNSFFCLFSKISMRSSIPKLYMKFHRIMIFISNFIVLNVHNSETKNLKLDKSYWTRLSRNGDLKSSQMLHFKFTNFSRQISLENSFKKMIKGMEFLNQGKLRMIWLWRQMSSKVYTFFVLRLVYFNLLVLKGF